MIIRQERGLIENIFKCISSLHSMLYIFLRSFELTTFSLHTCVTCYFQMDIYSCYIKEEDPAPPDKYFKYTQSIILNRSLTCVRVRARTTARMR